MERDMRGRKPIPKPLGDIVNMPGAVSRIPQAPNTLPEGLARECWDETVRVMVARNTYDEDASDMLQAYCIQRARWIESNERIAEMGIMLKSKQGRDAHNPWVAVSNGAFDRMVKLASDLGLSPVARSRVSKVRASKSVVAASRFLDTAS